ncbi:MAG: excinuclease ABC subunit A [Pirellulaceae bacterium]|jgi:excinuclease ABC subunit A
MAASDIVVKGAREHNLRDVSLTIPRNKLVCLTGVSGSGKSSLAFDTLYAEGQRRYVESLSSFARQFLGQMPKPEVDYISGLSPSISISQKATGKNPRSTVGTITEIYDYLRVLYARVGQGYCHQCDLPITAQTREQIITRIIQLEPETKFAVLAPLIRGQKGEYRDLFTDLLKQGYVRARVDGEVVSLGDELQLDRQMRHDIEVVIDRLVVNNEVRPRLAEAVELALKLGQGNLIVTVESSLPVSAEAETSSGRKKRGRVHANDILFSVDYACGNCGISFEPPTPQLFSFNSPQGMCYECDGLGELYSFAPELLIPEESLSFKNGAIELVGKWKEVGRWRRHIYQGMANTMERKLGLAENFLLETPWTELSQSQRDLWLWGTGGQHITFQWRGGSSPIKYGGKFEGVIPELLTKYRNSKSKPQISKLEQYMDTILCPDCEGERLIGQARAVRLRTNHKNFTDRPELTLPQLCKLPVCDAVDFFSDVELDATRQIIAEEALKEIRARFGFLMNVGLDYLSLNRTAPTLSGGESQRIRLAGQIGSGLVGVLYILDEPSIGLHPRDNDRLLQTLASLRDIGNTVLVVEHDEDTMMAADHIIDFGPGPGVRGGHVVAEGPVQVVIDSKDSITGKYLSGKLKIEVPPTRRPIGDERLRILGARHNNLRSIDVEIPLGAFVCVTGVSGSGKSSLVNDILVQALRRDLNGGEGEPGEFDSMEGIEYLDKLIAIDQSPIGRTPRSNPGTYIKVFDEIRNLFALLADSKKRGYKPGRFSFNVKGGRCEACEGNGSNRLEMDFLADVWVTCPVCESHRYNHETLQVKFKDYSIADVLEMDVCEALELFENIPKIKTKLQTLHDVGLDYLKLGQPSPTLSGGEAQRIKLARELVKRSTGQTMYLLDEPTTGLHFADIQMLLKVLHGFVDAGNTVLVVEHNLDVIKTADWVIDLGPEGGAGGGLIVDVGRPEDIVKNKKSHTGQALVDIFTPPARRKRKGPPKLAKGKAAPAIRQLRVQGARQHNLKGVDVEIERDKMTVFCGPSGSGKSSLAMDTIYAEGQRRYVESLSSYARQFVNQMEKPRLDHIEGLSPAIAIEQKNLGNTPRSTVGTVTEIYDYFRILLARLGEPHCPECDISIGTQTADQIIDKIMTEPVGSRLYLMAPLEVEVGHNYETLWEEIRAAGFVRVRVNKETHSIDELPIIDRRRRHDVEVVVDRLVIKKGGRSRIADSVESALALGKGVVRIAYVREDVPEQRWEVVAHSQHLACDKCGRSFVRLTPHNFSFNSQLGWCSSCQGLGTQTGANPIALLDDPKKSLMQGAVNLWPDVNQKVSQLMLQAMQRDLGVPVDIPFDQLSARHRRIVMHGADESWVEVKRPRQGKAGYPLFRFQFKGLYPALEEASRLSPTLRSRLEHLVDEVECSSCVGSRLRDDASAVRFRGRTIEEYCRLPLGELQKTIAGWKLAATEKRIAGELLREIKNRVQFLNDVGLHYLTIGRAANSLSNGEAQRIRLASQLGSGLCGVLYVLDEPTIGLHPRDNQRLLKALHRLRDLGNTLLIVEHDRDVIEGSDRICDFGPAAGKHGGEIVAEGTPKSVSLQKTSVTGPYLSGKKAIPVPTNRRVVSVAGEYYMADATLHWDVNELSKRPEIVAQKTVKKKAAKKTSTTKVTKKTSANKIAKSAPLLPPVQWLTIKGARHHNLRDVDAQIPLGALTAVTGPSGSGKSSLIDDVLHAALAKRLHRASVTPGQHDSIEGVEAINKVIRVDQQALGNSPTSNPATYTGLFEHIRTLFSQLPDAKVRGYTARRFSFNVAGGRCDSCDGNGQICIEMHFLPDVWVTCDTCHGKRYNPETLNVKYRGRSISDVLDMTCGEAVELFCNIPKLRRILQTLCDVGLDYLTLGQSAPTLSGGEAQRVKLAAELARPDTGRTLYLLDEPTTGLHFDDLAKLLDVLQRLVDLGNTVVLIEHNLDVIKTADWIIDMGPEAGIEGGQVVATGTPEDVVAKQVARKGPRKVDAIPMSHTAVVLRPVLKAGPHEELKRFDPSTASGKQEDDLDISEVGKDAKMPWQIDGLKWHSVDRVGRKGEPCKWDGKILAEVVDRIQNNGGFSSTDWNNRTIVEVAGKKKSDGWFLHAITGETWLLKLKFRVSRGTFLKQDIESRIELKTLNEMDDLPIYGNEPRVRCKTIKGPWQEIEIRPHSWQEIDTPEFWSFLDEAVAGFIKVTDRVAANPDDIMPWKKLGQKWHLLRRGFPPGKKILWEPDLLKDICETLGEVAPDGEFIWNNQQLIHYFVPQQQDPWATLHTKRPATLDLTLTGPKDQFAFGQIADLGHDSELDVSKEKYDQLKLKFRDFDDWANEGVRQLVQAHLEAVKGDI